MTEKYGVDLSDEAKALIKEAKENEDVKEIGACPRCGRKLRSSKTTNVPHCSVCGTEPFEGR